MNLDKYHVDLPYPTVRGLNVNKRQAMLLMQGYSGQTSELSTVTQYAYHKVKCIKHKELFDTLQGILLVEMHHLELLGNCINQLGTDPRYFIFLNERAISWQSEVINYESSIDKMILADIEGEKQATKYYQQTADIIGNEKISALLQRLSQDEELHVRIFTNLYNKYFR